MQSQTVLKTPDLTFTILPSFLFIVTQTGASHDCSSTSALGAMQSKKSSKKNTELTLEVGGSHSEEKLLENHKQITLYQYWHFGVVYHVYSVCIRPT